jgi:hypothetical protein
MTKTKISRLRLGLAAFLLLATNFVFLSNFAAASSLTNTYVRLSRIKSGATSNIRLQFKAVSSQTANVSIDMNGTDSGTSQWTNAVPGGLVSASQTPTTATCATETGDTALPGTLAASGTGSVITITGVTATTSGTTYCVDLASAVTNPTAGHEGEYHPTVTIGTDSSNVAVRIISNDQVVVNAVVPPSFNFAIGGCASNTDNFVSNLTASNPVLTAGCTLTVNTNAKTGWMAWASDSQSGLHSTQAAKTITSSTPGSNVTLANGIEGYLFGVTNIVQGSGAGVASATNAYGNGSGGVAGLYQGSGLDSTTRLIASSTGTASGAVVTVKSAASISALTPAGNDYTDTLTIIGAGSF